MSYFDYKVVPAPRRAKRSRGVNDPDELLALTLTEAINEHARQGWEYVRAELLAAEAPGRLFRRAKPVDCTLLVFRRPRETLGPKLAVEGTGASDTGTSARAEPVLEPVAGITAEASPASPLRPAPTLGSADQRS